jgi:hypothetical protein
MYYSKSQVVELLVMLESASINGKLQTISPTVIVLDQKFLFFTYLCSLSIVYINLDLFRAWVPCSESNLIEHKCRN